MSKQVNLDVRRQVNFPPKYTHDYWARRTEGSLRVQYNAELEKYGWPRLKAIAEKTLQVCDVWDSHGVHKAEMGSLDGVMYIAFPIRNPAWAGLAEGVTICIETVEGFEKNMGIRLADLAEYNYASDGQHKHEGTKS